MVKKECGKDGHQHHHEHIHQHQHKHGEQQQAPGFRERVVSVDSPKEEQVRALLIVDVQNDFIDGSLAVPNAEKIIPVINRLRSKKFDYIYVCLDWHPYNHCSFRTNNPGSQVFQVIPLPCTGNAQIMWPDHCVQGTKGAELHKDLVVETSDIFTFAGCNPQRDSYSVFKDNGSADLTEIKDLLEANNVSEIYAVGLATDYCVQYTVLDAKTLLHNVDVFFVEDGCKGIDQDGIDTAMKAFEFEKVHVIKSDGPEIGMIEDRKLNLQGNLQLTKKTDTIRDFDLEEIDDLYESIVFKSCEPDMNLFRAAIEKKSINKLCSWSGKNVLHGCCETGNVELLKELLTLGVDVVDIMVKSKQDDNALMFAVKCSSKSARIPMISLLLDGLPGNKRRELLFAQNEKSEMTALMFACRNGDCDMVEKLLQYDNTMQFLQLRSKFGKSAIMYACMSDSSEHAAIVEIILRSQAKVENRLELCAQRDTEAWNCLHFCAKSGCFAGVDWSRALNGYENVASLPINAVTNSGITFLHLAAFNGQSEVIRSILDCSKEVQGKKQKWLQRLLKKGLKERIEVNVPVKSTGDTELDLAIQRQHLECSRLLLRLGCHAGTASATAMHELLHRLVLMGDVEACESILNFADENRITVDSTLVEITERMEHPETCTFSFANYTNTAEQFIYECEFCKEKVCLVCKDRCHGPQSCRKDLNKVQLEHFPETGWKACGIVETYCNCKRDTCCATAATDIRELEGYRFLPAPISTSRIVLPRDMERLSKKIAKNMHNIWAEGKVKEGWHYGRDKDETQKLHPHLLPFRQLTYEGAKYNVDMANEMIKVIKALNYDIQLVNPTDEDFTPRKRTSYEDDGDVVATGGGEEEEEKKQEEKDEEKQANIVAALLSGMKNSPTAKIKAFGEEDHSPTSPKSPSGDRRGSGTAKYSDIVWRLELPECRPIETTPILFPDELAPLVERLAENAHEVWAAEKIRQGWRFAPARNIKKGLKLNSSLVPYFVLTEQEKEELRRGARETIKLILYYGYVISLPKREEDLSLAGGNLPSVDGNKVPITPKRKRKMDIENKKDLESRQLKHIRRKLFNQYLFAAVRRGQLESVNILLAKRSSMFVGADLNAVDEYGHTPLYISVKRGHVETTKRLLHLGANVEMRDINGFTPLAISAYLGNLKICQELVQKHAQILVNDNMGFTPLHHAANQGHVEVCQYLAEKLQQENQSKDIINLTADQYSRSHGSNAHDGSNEGDHHHDDADLVSSNDESKLVSKPTARDLIAKAFAGSRNGTQRLMGEPKAFSGMNVFSSIVAASMSKSKTKVNPTEMEQHHPEESPRGTMSQSIDTPRYSLLSTGSDAKSLILPERELKLSKFSPLSMAIRSNNIHVVEMLISHGGNPMLADGIKEEGSLFFPYVRALFRHMELLRKVEYLREAIQLQARIHVENITGGTQNENPLGMLLNLKKRRRSFKRDHDTMMEEAARVEHDLKKETGRHPHPAQQQQQQHGSFNHHGHHNEHGAMNRFEKLRKRADSKLMNFFGVQKQNGGEEKVSMVGKSMREMDEMLENAMDNLNSAAKMVEVLNQSKTVRKWREKCAFKMCFKETFTLVVMLLVFGFVVQLAPDYDISSEREWASRIREVLEHDTEEIATPEGFLTWLEDDFFSSSFLTRRDNHTALLSHNILIGGLQFQIHEHVALSQGFDRDSFFLGLDDKSANVTTILLPQVDLELAKQMLNNVSDLAKDTGIMQLNIEFNLYNPYLEVYGSVSLHQDTSFIGVRTFVIEIYPFRLGYGRFPPSRVFQVVIAGSFIFFFFTKLNFRGKRITTNTRRRFADKFAAGLLLMMLIFDLYVFEVSKVVDPHYAQSEFVEMNYIHTLLIMERRVIAAYFFLSMIPLLGAARTIPNIGPVVVALLNTMTHSAVIIYVMVFATACMLLSLTFHVGWGASVLEFGTGFSTLNTLFLTPFVETWDVVLEASESGIGHVLAIFYILFATITLNLLIAIVTDVYPNARNDSDTLWEKIITDGIESNLQEDVENNLATSEHLDINYWNKELILRGKDGVKHWIPTTKDSQTVEEINSSKIQQMEASITDLSTQIKLLIQKLETQQQQQQPQPAEKTHD